MCVQVTKTANRFEISSLLEKKSDAYQYLAVNKTKTISNSGNTYIYGETFNFNNPQSSQKRQSDDSGLQIANTKYKRIYLYCLVIPILSEL
jgi:hypothetical protein